MKPSSFAILKELNALAFVLGGLNPQEAEKRMKEAEAPLDALALKNPFEATTIFRRSRYFYETIGNDEVYLGQYVIVPAKMLSELNTPEKRAAFVAQQNEIQ